MKLTRRTLLGQAAALTATGLIARPAFANTTLESGSVRIDTLSDGHMVLPGDFILGPMPDPEAARIVVAHGLDPAELRPDCNLTLLRDSSHVAIFDAGAGPRFMPTTGQLWSALDTLGVDPAEITHVVMTHGHPDHLWGVLDDFDEPLFPNATHIMGAEEHAYWTDPQTVNRIGAARQAFAVGAARCIAAIPGGFTLIADGDSPLPGVTARATPGHTPGHLSYDIATPDGPVTVIGDAISNHHVAFAHPEWPSGSDQDQPLAAATRQTLMEDLATSAQLAIGFHLPAPGIGHVERDNAGYRFAPAL